MYISKEICTVMDCHESWTLYYFNLFWIVEWLKFIIVWCCQFGLRQNLDPLTSILICIFNNICKSMFLVNFAFYVSLFFFRNVAFSIFLNNKDYWKILLKLRTNNRHNFEYLWNSSFLMCDHIKRIINLQIKKLNMYVFLSEALLIFEYAFNKIFLFNLFKINSINS